MTFFISLQFTQFNGRECVKEKPYFYAKELKTRTERLILIVPFSLLFFLCNA